MSKYQEESSNASINPTVNTIDQNREDSLHYLVLASIVIPFSALVIILASAIIIYLYLKRRQGNKPTMSQFSETRGDEPVASMCGDGSYYSPGFEQRNDNSLATNSIAKNELQAPVTQQSASGYPPPSELGARASKVHSYRPELESHEAMRLYSIPSASVVVLPEPRGTRGTSSGAVISNVPSQGYRPNTTSNLNPWVLQSQRRPVHSEIESLSPQSHIARAPQTEDASLNPGTTSLLSRDSMQPAKKPRNRLSRRSKTNHPRISSQPSPPWAPLDLDSRLLEEEPDPTLRLPNRSQGSISAASEFQSVYACSSHSQLGVTELDSSSLHQAHPPPRFPTAVAGENYLIENQCHTVNSAYPSPNWSSVYMGPPQIMQQYDTGLTEVHSLDTSSLSATLSAPYSEPYHHFSNLPLNTGTPMATTTPSPGFYNPNIPTDETFHRPQLNGQPVDISQGIGLGTITEFDQINSTIPWSQSQDQHRPSLERGLPAQDNASEVDSCTVPGCDTTFQQGRSRATNLQRHILEMHTPNPKRYPCRYCPRDFSRKHYRDRDHEEKCQLRPNK